MKFPDISWTVRGTWHVKCYSYHARSNVTVSGVENIENIKDLGVTFDNKLKFDKHTNNKINTAYQMLKIVKRNFIYLTLDSFVVLYIGNDTLTLRICSQCVESSSVIINP